MAAIIWTVSVNQRVPMRILITFKFVKLSSLSYYKFTVYCVIIIIFFAYLCVVDGNKNGNEIFWVTAKYTRTVHLIVIKTWLHLLATTSTDLLEGPQYITCGGALGWSSPSGRTMSRSSCRCCMFRFTNQ